MRGSELERARDAYAACRWDLAHAGFAAAAEDGPLPDDDLAAYADAAWWLGRTDASLDLSEERYRRVLASDDAAQAARLAVEIGFLWLIRGEETIGAGWIARADRLLRDVPEGAEHGYLQNLVVLQLLDAGRLDEARASARRMCELGRRHGDATLCAVAQVLEGVAAIRAAALDAGLATIDEAMLAVRAGAVARTWAGNLYCQLMSVFLELGDLVRARAWTDATERWCEQHSHAAMFVGICRVHRAQLLHVGGALQAAERSALQACRDLADMNVAAVAAARYELGELHRRRGDLDAAERSYGEARELGHDPQPGLALVRLAQGRPAAARSAVDASLAATDQPLRRVPLLAARVVIARRLGDARDATDAADELSTIADDYGSPGVVATARRAAGTARLLAGDPDGALPLLRDAQRRWRELQAPLDAAHAQLETGDALDALGDAESARRERELARAALRAAGATVPDHAAAVGPATALTPREREILALVATGDTNAAIAATLTLSERTVERHLSNIFRKLRVASRTEAARFAFAHGLARADG